MKLFRLRASQRLPVSLDEAWAFFSNPANLARITPPSLGFEITAALPDEIYAGMLITYRVRPIMNVPLDWLTEIKNVDKPRYFSDEQRLGPYRFWHHQHFFDEVPGGVRVRDLVHYALSFGPLSGLANALVVRRQLHTIFSYRRDVLRDLFGPSPP